MSQTLRTFVYGAAGAWMVGLLAGCRVATDPIYRAAWANRSRVSPAEVRSTAEEGFLYGFPLVINYAVLYVHSVDRESEEYQAPCNIIHSKSGVVKAGENTVVTVNSDTPYSSMMMDLRAEPLVLSVPAVPPPRYYAVQLCDGNAFNYGYIGSRATGPEAGDYLVAGPDWRGEAPAGVKEVFRSSTQFSLALYRTQLFGSNDMENVRRVQAGYKAQTLSAYLGQPPPPPAPAIAFPRFHLALLQREFFDFLCFAMQFAPAGPEEKDIREKLARIGVEPGRRFEYWRLTPRHQAEIAAGMVKATFRMSQYALQGAHGSRSVNGWLYCEFFGDRAFYRGDWLKRAVSVAGGIFGNDAAEALYLMAVKLPSGERLDGSKSNYTLTFAPGALPPVNAFWSVTLYNALTFKLVDNPIHRHLINSAMLSGMRTNADGSVTIYVQKDSPGADKEPNWLPARNGLLMLVMRLYWPEPAALDGTWKPPAIVKAR